MIIWLENFNYFLIGFVRICRLFDFGWCCWLAICLAVYCLVFLVLTNNLFFGPFFLEDFNSVLAD